MNATKPPISLEAFFEAKLASKDREEEIARAMISRMAAFAEKQKKVTDKFSHDYSGKF